MDLRLVKIGVGVRHDGDFVIDRPHGSGDCLFLRFLTPVRLHSRAGPRREAAGACILYTPPFPQWYRGADGEGFEHDWFHFHGRDRRRVVRAYGLPKNTVFRPRRDDRLRARLERLKEEHERGEEHHRRAEALLIEEVLLLLARYRGEAERRRLTPRKAALLDGFRSLRARVRERPEEGWPVASMAEAVHLSPSRFSVLYREFFEVSPAEDLIRLRLDKARWLLTNTTLAVGEVAARSGFSNIYYFSRLFRRRVGCPPRAYYRRLIAEDGRG